MKYAHVCKRAGDNITQIYQSFSDVEHVYKVQTREPYKCKVCTVCVHVCKLYTLIAFFKIVFEHGLRTPMQSLRAVQDNRRSMHGLRTRMQWAGDKAKNHK